MVWYISLWWLCNAVSWLNPGEFICAFYCHSVVGSCCFQPKVLWIQETAAQSQQDDSDSAGACSWDQLGYSDVTSWRLEATRGQGFGEAAGHHDHHVSLKRMKRQGYRAVSIGLWCNELRDIMISHGVSQSFQMFTKFSQQQWSSQGSTRGIRNSPWSCSGGDAERRTIWRHVDIWPKSHWKIALLMGYCGGDLMAMEGERERLVIGGLWWQTGGRPSTNQYNGMVICKPNSYIFIYWSVSKVGHFPGCPLQRILAADDVWPVWPTFCETIRSLMVRS